MSAAPRRAAKSVIGMRGAGCGFRRDRGAALREKRPSLVTSIDRAARLSARRAQLRQFAPSARNPSRPFLIPGERSDREWTRPTFAPGLPAHGSARWAPCPANIRGFPPANSHALVAFRSACLTVAHSFKLGRRITTLHQYEPGGSFCGYIGPPHCPQPSSPASQGAQQ